MSTSTAPGDAGAQGVRDTTIERYSPDALAALGRRVLEVAPSSTDVAPISPEVLRQLATDYRAEREMDTELRAQLTQLAAWVKHHRGDLSQAYTGPTTPYDHLQGFWSNFYGGPRNGDPFPYGDMPRSPTTFLGFSLDFPFGVAACAFMPNAGYLGFFARRGFDLLTYKTVRDRPWDALPFPNIAFAENVAGPLSTEALEAGVQVTPDHLAVIDPARASLVNSFGVPSVDVEHWQRDVETAKAEMAKGQVLVVSVMGSPEVAETPAELARQFGAAAVAAQEAGADIVEVNLSCPNSRVVLPWASERLACRDVDLSAEILREVRRALRNGTPVLMKIGYMDRHHLDELLTGCSGLFDGVVAINAVPSPARSAAGRPFFGDRFDDRAGISGPAIRGLGLEVVENLADFRALQTGPASDWVIVGVGGVSSGDDYAAYRSAGADAVQSCTGAWLNHRLAHEVRTRPARRGQQKEPAVRLLSASSRSDVSTAQRRQARAEGRTFRRHVHGLANAVRTGGVSLLVDSSGSPDSRRDG